MASFLDSIKFDDLSYSFKTESDDPAVKRLHQELNEAMLKLRSSRREKDSEFLFFKNIVMHVGIGLIVFKRRRHRSRSSTAPRASCCTINRRPITSET